MSKPELYLCGMWGLGDNFYQRPFIRLLAQTNDVYLDTPWPEVYADLGIHFVKGYKPLRTQLKNVARQPYELWEEPSVYTRLNARIHPTEMTDAYRSINYHFNIVDGMFQATGLPRQPLQWDFPPGPIASRDRPFALIRPVTVRREWSNQARNPLPEYVGQVAEWLRTTHHVIVVADIDECDETLIGELPPHDEYLNGVPIPELFALIRGADVLAGPVGWIVPVGISAGINTFVILGGQLGMNSPLNITSPQYMDTRRIHFATPDDPCNCLDMGHQCDKQISNLREQFLTFRRLFENDLRPAA